MIRVRVNSVGSDGVDAELLENRHISLADLLIGERVNILIAARGVTPRASACLLLVGNTLDEELVAALGEELGSLFMGSET